MQMQRPSRDDGWPRLRLFLFLLMVISSSSVATGDTSLQIHLTSCKSKRKMSGTAPECPSWLGLSSGAIQDWQMAASSHWTGGEDPNGCQARFARLYHAKAWCAKHRSSGEWILVDLGVLSQVSGKILTRRKHFQQREQLISVVVFC